jgi:DNA-binding transcriptional regulator YiaG
MSLFLELKAALQEVRDYRAGKRKDLPVTRLAPLEEVRPNEVVNIRKTGQQEFARLLNTSVGTVRSWEQGSRRRQSTALLVLAMAKTNPAVLLTAGRKVTAAGPPLDKGKKRSSFHEATA